MDLAVCHDASFQATVNGTDHDMRMGITLFLLLGLAAGLTSCRGTDSKVSSLVDLDTPSALAGEGEFLDGDDFFEDDIQYFEDDGGDPAAVAYKAGKTKFYFAGCKTRHRWKSPLTRNRREAGAWGRNHQKSFRHTTTIYHTYRKRDSSN